MTDAKPVLIAFATTAALGMCWFMAANWLNGAPLLGQ
jgi:hypothetical protein